MYRHIQLHVYIYKYMRNIIKHNIRTSMNERTHFFIKIYLSHFILERIDVGCVWEMSWKRRQTAILTPSSSGHSSTSSSSWLGCSTVGHWGPKALCRPLALNSAPCPQLTPTATDSSRLCPGYIFVWRPPASAVLPLIYTGASLDWRFGRGSICYTSRNVTFTGEWWTLQKVRELDLFIRKK